MMGLFRLSLFTDTGRKFLALPYLLLLHLAVPISFLPVVALLKNSSASASDNRDRGGGGAGRAAAPPLFCAPAPTFCAKKKNN